MEVIKDLRVLKAIINKSKLTTNNSNLIIDKQHILLLILIISLLHKRYNIFNG